MSDLEPQSHPDEVDRGLSCERTEWSRAALQSLAERWPDETTRKFLQERAIDVSSPGGQRAENRVVLGKMHSEFGRIVCTKDIDGIAPYLDPAKPISRRHIERAAARAKVPPDKIDETVRSLSAHMGWDITKGAGA